MSIFGGMKIYTVHVKSDAVRAGEKPIFVREGFNVWAFLLTGFWALYHRLWLPMTGIGILNTTLVQMATHHMLGQISMGVLQLALNLLVGFQANDWLRTSLAKRGYLFTDITASDSLLRAEQRYFERHLETLAA